MVMYHIGVRTGVFTVLQLAEQLNNLILIVTSDHNTTGVATALTAATITVCVKDANNCTDPTQSATINVRIQW
jgi:alkaline phosphatase